MSEKRSNAIHRFDDPQYYYNRELSWLDFNARVIDEAYDDSNTYLERLNFLAIASSNLDEFFEVRVASVHNLERAGVEVAENKTQMTPTALIEAISERNRQNLSLQYDRYQELIGRLDRRGHRILSMKDLDEAELAWTREYFHHYILASLSPLGIDSYRPFPNLTSKSLNLFVGLSQSGVKHEAIVPIPALLDRYIVIDVKTNPSLILIEDLIAYYLPDLFQGYEIDYAYPFRITRNADFDVIEDRAEDYLVLIEDYIKERRKGFVVRLEIDRRSVEDFGPDHYQTLMDEFEIQDRDLYCFDGPLDLTFLFGLRDLVGQEHPEDLYKDFQPFLNPAHTGPSLFKILKHKDLFFNHPYDSFGPVVSLIETAADDPDTISIKMTLYRVSKKSPIIKALKRAAENGKEVTVLVELKARFDEENNVFWARELEEAGVHVLYGVSELKTHSKIALVVRREDDEIRSYLHLGTGNYNDKTAKIYTDMGIMTTNPEMTEDATKFFHYLSGYSARPEYKHLHVSPFAIRDSLMDYIDEEIDYQQEHGNGHIIAKMNSLTDKTLIQKLYEASQAGVTIDLIVRGICCLKPGIPGVSDNITVRSVVGRFLEHSRVYYFYRNGARHLFLSSADMMTRNMTKRVEIEFPILNQGIEAEIIKILNLQLEDTLKARVLDEDGVYRRPDRSDVRINSQEVQMQWANEKTAMLESVIKENSPQTGQSLSADSPRPTSLLERLVNYFKKN